MKLVPSGTQANRSHFSAWTAVDPSISAELSDLLYDPQTSGGLILGVPEDRVSDLKKGLSEADGYIAAEIGEVAGHDPDGALVLA